MEGELRFLKIKRRVEIISLQKKIAKLRDLRTCSCQKHVKYIQYKKNRFLSNWKNINYNNSFNYFNN
jgi:hypothetical protein